MYHPFRMKTTLIASAWILGVALLTAVDSRGEEAQQRIEKQSAPVDYTTQIKPIFAEHCYDCHGGSEQESGFRIDTAVLAMGGGDRGAAIVPGKSEQSLLYQALIGEGEVAAMPAESARLGEEQLALIKRWIDEGAQAPKDEVAEKIEIENDHWAFQSITRPAIPPVEDQSWIRNPIDAFVLARLEREGLQPSPAADRATLIRRLSLDLRGITPSPVEVDLFHNDRQPGAYERLVERMLASPHYGERWGRHWLDAARYADSHGFTIDGPRSIWKYRDWVIDAWNRDLPFDQFTIEQLAGDLLPHATTDQIVATGFHRNTLINQEGGTDDEQFRVESIVDRVNTTGAVYLGLTIGCAQCHPHKYDPIPQREYYQLFAIFNDCDEPNIQVPTPAQSGEQNRLRREIAAVEKQLRSRDAEYLKGLPAWEKELADQRAGAWTTLNPVKIDTRMGTVMTKLEDNSLVVDFSVPANDTFSLTADLPVTEITAVRLEALTHSSLPKNGPGRGKNGNFVLSEFELETQPLDDAGQPTGRPQKAKIAKAVADHSQVGYAVAAAIDGNQKTGWAINVDKGNSNVDREAIFIAAQPIRNPHGTRVIVHLHQNHGDAGYLLGRYRLSVSSASPAALEIPASVRKILAIAAKQRTEEQRRQLESSFKQGDPVRKPISNKLGVLKQEQERLNKAIPTTMVMRKRKKPRESYIHIRGDFLRKGARVEAGFPAVLSSSMKVADKPTRLDLAHWLVDPAHPLTARVTVNRFWQRLFGKGFVQTENEFGSQGSPPTHPALLDWLASEFIDRAWSMKSLHRLIVTSATYRQSSRVRDELLNRDQSNNLLARQSRVRLEAEIIRDVCLSSSGLFTPQIGGPSVYPPQPEGIYVLTQQKKAWPEEQGAERYRRGMYTYFWRSSPYPFLPTFDAPDANTTCTRRPRSNTPLQALTLANDRSFFEIAQGLATRVLNEASRDDRKRIGYLFRLCLARDPGRAELDRLVQFLAIQRQRFGSDQADAKLVAPVERPADVPLADAAAWTALARVMMNLDEFITRE